MSTNSEEAGTPLTDGRDTEMGGKLGRLTEGSESSLMGNFPSGKTWWSTTGPRAGARALFYI
jgi:hypothetical protein